MLEDIKTTEALRSMSMEQLKKLAAEIRQKIIRTVLENGGHLASNLGMVEATIALHRTFSSPRDSIIFDVGHQCYAHKLLCGRAEEFSTLRREGGVSGFTCPDESEHDKVFAGHSGSSLSAAIGIAEANRIAGSDAYAVAVIGDGSFTNGMIYEAMNCCAGRKLRLIILLNDNEMSISKNVGGLSRYFSTIRVSGRYYALRRRIRRRICAIPLVGTPLNRFFSACKNLLRRAVIHDNMFEAMGLEYLGPVDGGDISHLCVVLEEAKTRGESCLVHITTKKGRGYAPAEQRPDLYHAVPPAKSASAPDCETYSSLFGKLICAAAEKDDHICAITAAMCDGTGLKNFAKAYPDRFFDVGIAEEHAAALAGALAKGGITPVYAVYSTFAQRICDQLIHDVALQRSHVVLALDRCGFVPDDGVTHQGIFDVALFRSIPGVTIHTPETFHEMRDAFDAALSGEGLHVLRYPKGSENASGAESYTHCDYIKMYETAPDARLTIITYGRITTEAVRAADILAGEGIRCRVLKLTRIEPVDYSEIATRISGKAFFLEEGIRRGGAGEAAAAALGAMGIPVEILAIEQGFLSQGTVESLIRRCALDGESVAKRIKESINHEPAPAGAGRSGI